MKKDDTSKEVTNFFDKEFMQLDRFKLCELTPIEQFDFEIQEILRAGYSHPHSSVRRATSILNAIYTQKNRTCALSYRIVDALVRADERHHGLKSCDDDAYKDLMHRLQMSGVFAKIRNPINKSPGVKGKAGLYKLILPKFVRPLERICAGILDLDQKDEAIIRWWDGEFNDPEPEHVLTDEDREMFKKGKQVMEEKRGRKQD